jgi:hypothetical protein
VSFEFFGYIYIKTNYYDKFRTTKKMAFEDAKELQIREDIYDANDEELKRGTAVKTEIALASHAAAKAEVGRRKDNYYKLEKEIDRIESMTE